MSVGYLTIGIGIRQDSNRIQQIRREQYIFCFVAIILSIARRVNHEIRPVSSISPNRKSITGIKRQKRYTEIFVPNRVFHHITVSLCCDKMDGHPLPGHFLQGGNYSIPKSLVPMRSAGEGNNDLLVTRILLMRSD
ncbi:protein of unknown function [Cupriavidus taiwanensis]|uniref:Uncharacterized protein n=1 Tax=Cupriavidus taiwanensis TaxID=164546 RepID=A0A375IDN3_9BURK|nr:protein of unknown function [Cupriavidus taiwanensis]